MFIIWYNPSHNSFYFKNNIGINFEYHVGYTNQFEHTIVQIIVEGISCDSYLDYLGKRKQEKRKKEKVINRIIDFLHKQSDK